MKCFFCVRNLAFEAYLEHQEALGAVVNLRDIREFYQEKEFTIVVFGGEVCATFCINRGRQYRSLQVLPDPDRVKIEQMTSEDDAFEVINFTIRPEFRGRWQSVLIWFVLGWFIVRCDRRNLLFATVEPSINRIYSTIGKSPTLAGELEYLNGRKPFFAYCIPKAYLWWGIPRAALIRMIRRSRDIVLQSLRLAD